eukprot:CAMPEP_0171701170 /NCGR_PEP_ID=MMETSP0991-20121206/10910_1 /TAXON_ID=483369 /ORGANISM="non described non described, Strain CCMP2098" /LENGTH=351 /DNA_ID=CAMNT_0012290409 /DNA_START=38 /DNA_END=1093 /DNA_ORIENTATION=+
MSNSLQTSPAIVVTTLLGAVIVEGGHWYRLARPLRFLWGDEARPLQPVQIQSLMAQRKLEIHLSISASILIDLIFEIGFQIGCSFQALFILHSLAFIALYFGVATYLNQASKVVYIEGRMKALHCTLLATSAVLFVLWGAASFECIRADSFETFVVSRWYVALGWFEVLSLMFLAGAYVLVACMLQRRMWGVLGPLGSNGEGGSGGSLFWWALLRMNAVMVCCTVSFLLRAFLIAGTVLTAGQSDSEHMALSLRWCLDREWLPAAMPSLALLYVMRDARHAGPPPPSTELSWEQVSSPDGLPGGGIEMGTFPSEISAAASGVASVSVLDSDIGHCAGLAPGRYQLVDPIVH